MSEHSLVLQTSELTVVVGDNQPGAGPHADHRANYNGLWSLVSRRDPRGENCFVPSFAGVNLEHFMDELFMTGEGGDIFEPRRLPMRLERLSPTAASLSHDESPLTGASSVSTFELREPDVIDFSFHLRLHRPPREGSVFGVFWASYINAPLCPALTFPDANGLWSCLAPDAHGAAGNTLCHRSVENPSFGAPARPGRNPDSLAHAFSRRCFDRPLMFGRPGDGTMMLLQMFDQSAPVRLTMSPCGAGPNAPKGLYNPAWDFQYVLDNAAAGSELRLRARLVYKPWAGLEEVDRLYNSWKPTR